MSRHQASVVAPSSNSRSAHRYGPVFRTAATVGGVWWLGLLLLALMTGNPVSVNYRLIDLSDHVVSGKYLSGNEINIERDWKRQGPTQIPKGKLHVKNLERIPNLQPGGSYIIPLVKNSTGYAVTADPNRRIDPQAYPATPEVLRQLKAILDDLARLP